MGSFSPLLNFIMAFLDFAIPGFQSLMNLGSSLIGNKLNRDNARLQAELSLDNAKAMSDYNDAKQRAYVSDLAMLNKSSLQKAGFSVSSLNDGFQNATSNAAATAPVQGVGPTAMPQFNFLEMLNMSSQNKLLKQETRKAAAEASSAESKAEIDKLEAASAKSLGAARASDIVNRTTPEDGGAMVTAPAPKYLSSAQYDFLLGLPRSRALREISDNDAAESKSRLEKMVSDAKIADKEVVDALGKMDVATYKQILENVNKLSNENNFLSQSLTLRVEAQRLANSLTRAQTRNLDSGTSLNNVKVNLTNEQLKQIKAEFASSSNYDWRKILTRIENEGFSFENAVKLVITMLAGFLSKNGNVAPYINNN